VGIVRSYRLRLQRKRWRIRAFRKRRELQPVNNRTKQVRPGDILLFSTQRNEMVRLPYFLKYYRDLGV
jgi:ASC-1-like (ASCH) protein